ncbi:MAG: hypothetical protein ACI4WG_02965 [Erysipelotrichaceae bacterium]
MNENCFSKTYAVRKLNDNDLKQIYDLCRKNTLYYQYCPPSSILSKYSGRYESSS